MAFHDQNYFQRMEKGGDPAESQFKAYAQRHNISFERYGFDRSKLKNFRLLPEFVRVTPDFACVAKIGFLVECKGVGRDGIVKLKVTDLYQMTDWLERSPVYLFINDSYRKKVALAPLESVLAYLEKNHVREEVFESDGKAYYPVPRDFFLVWEKAASKQEIEDLLKEEKEAKIKELEDGNGKS